MFERNYSQHNFKIGFKFTVLGQELIYFVKNETQALQ